MSSQLHFVTLKLEPIDAMEDEEGYMTLSPRQNNQTSQSRRRQGMAYLVSLGSWSNIKPFEFRTGISEQK